jgi:hypothetical protein
MNVNTVGRAKWIKRGENVHINGFQLFSGLFYLGKTFGAGSEKYDRFVIPPALPIAKNGNQYRLPGDFMPSYEEMEPSARRGYLTWLSGGCRDTAIDVRFMRLHLSGLSYRVFVEKGEDRAVVIEEVKRLFAMYKDRSPPIRDLLLTFLMNAPALDCVKGTFPVREDYWALAAKVLSPMVLVHMGALIKDRRPVDADSALLWATEVGKLGGAALNGNDDVLKQLWVRKFKERYPSGIVVNDQPRMKLTNLTYPMPDGVTSVRLQLPDWCAALPLANEALDLRKKVTALLSECNNELSPYATAVKKGRGGRESIAVVGSLPKELIASSLSGRIAQVKAALDNSFAKSGMVVTPSDQLLRVLEIAAVEDSDLTPSVRKMIDTVLDKMDAVYEPDSRYGDRSLPVKGKVVMLRGLDGLPVRRGPSYLAYQTLVDIVILHLGVVGSEADRVKSRLYAMRKNETGLDGDQHVRLSAYTEAMLANAGGLKFSYARLGKLDANVKTKLAGLLSDYVAHSDITDVAQVEKLEKVYEKLALTREKAYSDLHRTASASKAAPRAKHEKAAETSLPVIDFNLLAKISKETEVVSGILSDIFSETQVDEPRKAATAKTAKKSGAFVFDGLDAAHSALLAKVMTGPVSRAGFDVAAKEEGLLPDGALETINDWGFDTVGEAVVIEAADIIFEEHLRNDIDSTRKSA